MLFRFVIITFISILTACSNFPRSANTSLEPLQNGEKLMLSVPVSSWELVFKTKQENMSMKEYVPAGQTVKDWDEMLTTQIFYGGINKSPLEFAKSFSALSVVLCPNSKYFPGREGLENGYKFFFWRQVCSNNPQTSKPEVAFFKAIEGNDSFYVVHKAWKRVPSDKEIQLWENVLSQRVRVCDPRLAKQSCSK